MTRLDRQSTAWASTGSGPSWPRTWHYQYNCSLPIASPLLHSVIMMPCLSVLLSSKLEGGGANLTEGWLTAAVAVANCLIFMCYCFQCPTSQRDLTALLTSYPVSKGDIYMTQQFNKFSYITSWASQDHLCVFYISNFLNFSLKCFPMKIKAKLQYNYMKIKCLGTTQNVVLTLLGWKGPWEVQRERLKRR